MEQNDAFAGRTADDTEANVSKHHENDGLEVGGKQYRETYREAGVVDSGVDDITTDKSKMPHVEREATIAGGAGAGGVPFSNECEFGGRVGDEEVGAASILDGKSSSVGVAKNDDASDSENLPLGNFPPGGLNYGDAL